VSEASAQAKTLIESAISSLGLDPNGTKVEGQDKWKFSRGTATIAIRLFFYEEKDGIEICSEIVAIPEDAEARLRLYDKIMVLNDALVGAWFVNRESDLYLVYARHLAGLDQSEVIDMIDRVSGYADRFDDDLRAEFAPK